MTLPLVSVVVITQNRKNDLRRCIQSIFSQQDENFEVLVIDNASQDGTCEMLARDFPDVHIHRSETNLGVPGGRNLGFKNAAGNICITIDDDAEFMQPDSIRHVRRYFEEDSALACISFQILEGSERKVAQKFVPRRDRKIFSVDTEGALFCGTGFAVRRDMFLELGGFWEMLAPYFGEEPDLSYRMLERGYKILHTVQVPVLHHESPVMRPNERRTYCGARNTPWIAIRSLPWFPAMSLIVLSSGYFFLIAVRQGHVRAYLRGIKDSLEGAKSAYRLRQQIGRKATRKLKKYSGLFYY